MTQDFEYNSYNDADRIAILENRAADLERRLLAFVPPDPATGWRNVAMPADRPLPDPEPGPMTDEPYLDDFAAGPADQPGGPGTGARTEALINHGRRPARRSRTRRVLAHWRLLLSACVALVAGVDRGRCSRSAAAAPGWPASVASVRAEIKQACANPDVAAEPSGLNFACAKDTQQVLWVFSLLTSGNNPGYVDQGNWPQGPRANSASPGRGHRLVAQPAPPVQPGEPASTALRSRPARSTTSSAARPSPLALAAHSSKRTDEHRGELRALHRLGRLDTRQGYPAACASPVTRATARRRSLAMHSSSGWAARRRRSRAEAGILFQNADNPGSPKVQAILGPSRPASLPAVAAGRSTPQSGTGRAGAGKAAKPGVANRTVIAEGGKW